MRRISLAALTLSMLLVLQACGEEGTGNQADRTDGTTGTPSTTGGAGTSGDSATTDGSNESDNVDAQVDVQDDELPPDEGSGTEEGSTSGAADGMYSIVANASSVTLQEGEDSVSVEYRLTRSSGHDADITLSVLAVADASAGDRNGFDGIELALDDDVLDSDDSNSDLSLSLPVGARPILGGEGSLQLRAVDDDGAEVLIDLPLQVVPTSRPDVYLLAGQSNMVGFSEDDSRQALTGQPDEPDERIRQLNPTGNDQQNFRRAPDFTDTEQIAAASPRYTIALDPLHDGFDSSETILVESKSTPLIGPGLSFAKRALRDTSAEIILVPAAWSDTGFCARSSNVVAGMGWNADARRPAPFSGSLLHDRAIARTNLAIEGTGGILRGILWHQGEADSGNARCAAAYADSLVALAESLRSEILPDARGPDARGPDAPIPFIVGTMSRGSDARGSQLPFSDIKLQVDAAHRSIASRLPFAEFVNNDDLVPPAYPCGQGSCVHFGAAAYREMGERYYERLLDALSDPDSSL